MLLHRSCRGRLEPLSLTVPLVLLVHHTLPLHQRPYTLVCKGLYSYAQSLVYRRLDLDLRHASHANLMHDLLRTEDEVRLHAVKHLSIDNHTGQRTSSGVVL